MIMNNFLGTELDHIFDFVYLIETENFVNQEFITPNMLDWYDIPPMMISAEFD